MQYCDVIVFENSRFHRPHKNTKTTLSRISTLESVFGRRFHRIRVDGRLIRKEKVAFSNENGYTWTGSKRDKKKFIYMPLFPGTNR